ncbi:MAG: hypothetical protein QXP80_03700 [Zestosphaera sp.]
MAQGWGGVGIPSGWLERVRADGVSLNNLLTELHEPLQVSESLGVRGYEQ